MGFSVITMIEIIALVILLFMYLFCRGKTNPANDVYFHGIIIKIIKHIQISILAGRECL